MSEEYAIERLRKAVQNYGDNYVVRVSVGDIHALLFALEERYSDVDVCEAEDKGVDNGFRAAAADLERLLSQPHGRIPESPAWLEEGLRTLIRDWRQGGSS